MKLLSKSLLFLGLATAATAACADLGERAGQGGDCPDLESCSPATPKGLSFASAGFGGFGGGIFPVAIGGRIDLRLTDLATGSDLLRPYRASTGGALTVEAQRENVVSLRGVSTAGDTLRITDPDSGALFDQIGVLAMPIEAVRARPDFLLDLSLLYLPREAQERPLALLAGGAKAPVIFELLGAGATRVIDEDLVVSGDATIEAAGSWDQRTVASATAGPLELQLRAGGRAWPLQLPVVSEPEAIEGAGSAARIHVGDTPAFCFNAVAAGRNVLGVPWTFTSTGVTGKHFFETSCFSVDAIAAAGPASVTAAVATSSGTRTMTLAFTVEPKAANTTADTENTARAAAPSAPSAPANAAAAAAASPGERARYSSSPVQ